MLFLLEYEPEDLLIHFDDYVIGRTLKCRVTIIHDKIEITLNRLANLLKAI